MGKKDFKQPSLHLVTPNDPILDQHDGGAIAVEMARAIPELLEELDVSAKPESGLAADAMASAIAAAFRLGTTETSLIGQSSATLGQRHDSVEEKLLAEGMTELLDALTKVGAQEQAAAMVLQSLVVYGGPFRAEAAASLASIDPDQSQGQDESQSESQGTASFWSEIGQVEVVSASLLSFIPGDMNELVLELAYPTASDERAGIVVMLDTFAGQQPLDALVCHDLDEYLAELANAGLPDESSELPVAEAMGLLHHGFWMFDHTLDAADHLDEESDLLLVRPLLDRLLATHPQIDYEPRLVSEEERTDSIGDFSKWATVEDPELAEQASEWAKLLVDFAADQAHDPLRWSQVVAVEFLYFASQKVMAPPEELACIPDVLRLMIQWSHQQKGWPSGVTDETLAAVDRVQPLFDADLSGGSDLEFAELANMADGLLPGGLLPDGLSALLAGELVEPPIGGTHPEPFADVTVADHKLRQRALAIAEAASGKAAGLFDPEFVTLVRRMTVDLANHPKTPIGRGKTTIWASAVVYAVAQLNEIPGGWSPLAIAASDITDRLDGAPGTITGKAKTVRDLLDVDAFPPETRYQHSTSTAATSDLLSSMANLIQLLPGSAAVSSLGSAAVPSPDGTAVGSGGTLHPLRPAAQPGSVDPASIGADCFVARVSLVGSRPEIWRRLRLPVDATFSQLHQLLQVSMGWYGGHLHLFDLGAYTVGPELSEMGIGLRDDVDEAELRLCDALTAGSRFLYIYDLGDNWEHQVLIEGAEDVDARHDELTKKLLGPFALLGGAMAGPPEDCGGIWGYQELLQAMKDKRHPRRSDVSEWLPVGFNPKHFDGYTLNTAIQNRPW